MKKSLLLAALLLPCAAQAESIVATCYEPSGYRVEVFQGDIDKGEDGYSNSSPTFFYSSNESEILIESWQAALPSPELISRAEADAILPPSAIKSEIIIKTDENRVRPQKSEVNRLVCDNSKIKKFTKWQPKYNLDQGLKETIEWLEQNKKLFKFDIYNQ